MLGLARDGASAWWRNVLAAPVPPATQEGGWAPAPLRAPRNPAPTPTRPCSFWAVLLLRVLSFVLPLYLVVQACVTFQRYRSMRAAPAGVPPV